MKKFDKTPDRYYWKQYCKGRISRYPSYDNSKHLSVSVSGDGKVDNIVFVVKQREPIVPDANEAVPIETVSKQQPAAGATRQPAKEKKGGNIWKWCLAVGLLAGVAILGHRYLKSDKAA